MLTIGTSESLIVAPTEEPLSLDAAKLHLRFKPTTEDTLILGWIAAAAQFFEEETGRQLTTATWEYRLDCFPTGPIELPHPPLRSVTSVAYIDAGGVLQPFADVTVSPAVPLYHVQAPQGPSAPRGFIAPKYGYVWPQARDEMGAVRIRFVAGYGTAEEVPAVIRTALGYLVGHFHKYRAESFEGSTEDLTLGARSMLRAFKSRPVYEPRRWS